MEEMDWVLYAQMDLEKSAVGVSAENDDEKFIEGVMLTNDVDLQNERPLLKAMDWTYFDKNGLVKYEHDGLAGSNPNNVIAIPHNRISTEKGEFLKARLLFRSEEDTKKGVPDHARATAALIKAVREHNIQYPDKQRTIGFSVEGRYLGKSGSGEYWGRPINVVVSANPIGTETYAEISKAHNYNLIKSLMTGSACGLTDQTGGAALRRESIADSVKNQSIRSKGVTRMDFKNRDEAKKHFIDKEGLSDEDAMKKAIELFPEEDGGEVKKSLGLLQKSINALMDLVKAKKEPEPEMKEDEKEEDEEEEDEEEEKKVDKVLGKSYGLQADDVADITPFFKSLIANTNQNGKVGVELAKSMEAMAGVIDTQAKQIESMQKSLADTQKMLKAIGEGAQGISFLNLDKETIIDGDKKMSKALAETAMLDLMKKGRIPAMEVVKFNMTGQVPQHIAELPEFKEYSR